MGGTDGDCGGGLWVVGCALCSAFLRREIRPLPFNKPPHKGFPKGEACEGWSFVQTRSLTPLAVRESEDHTEGPRRLFGYFLSGEKVSSGKSLIWYKTKISP